MTEIAITAIGLIALIAGLAIMIVRRPRPEPPRLSGAERHRERWIETGDPDELERMLREME